MSITREKILELGEFFIQTKGYNAFSYNDISKELGVKNAAIHYYFPTKASLGISILKNNILRFEEMTRNMEILKHNESQKLESFIKIYVKSNREHKICLIGSLGSDYITLDGSVQKELTKMTDLIASWLSEVLETGREKGLFQFKGTAHSRALLLLSNLMGALQLAWITNKNTFKTIHTTILEELYI
ncbi:TetR/AcrR family transcriptional regulator [Rapidithrix thailandica]|uniref:TetR/AcrR family transcriptional regulator n=1 Tax=Rapidithrix thailandica TaxID=413964 RepID=A0AAW9S400_9BACT